MLQCFEGFEELRIGQPVIYLLEPEEAGADVISQSARIEVVAYDYCVVRWVEGTDSYLALIVDIDVLMYEVEEAPVIEVASLAPDIRNRLELIRSAAKANTFVKGIGEI